MSFATNHDLIDARRLGRKKPKRADRQRTCYRNPNDQEFDSDQYFIAMLIRTIRTGIKLVNRSQPCKLHYIDITDHDIPLQVKIFLGKAEKLVPSQASLSWKMVYEALVGFEQSVLRSAAMLQFRRQKPPDPLHK